MLTRRCARRKSYLNLQFLKTSTRVIRLLGFIHILLFSSVLAENKPVNAINENIILTITLNEEHKGEFLVYMTPDGNFLVKPEDFKAIGIGEPEGELINIDGIPHLSLKSMKDIEFLFDEKSLTLKIMASPRFLPRKTIDFLPERRHMVYYPRDNSLFLNYGINYSKSDPSTPDTYGLVTELGVRLRDILILSNHSYTKEADNETTVRLMSSIYFDKLEDKQRFVIGDFYAYSGNLGSNVNLGGISFSKIYHIDPYFIKNPLFNLSGVVTTPSEVDVYLDGSRIRSEKLSPGEFDLKNINYYGGSALAEVVIRDAFGREQRISQSFYFTDVLLRKGLHEYSYNVGLMREDFGVESNNYGDAAFSLLHRYGATDIVTAGLRAEGSKAVYSLGPEASLLMGNAGIFTASFSVSKDDIDGGGFAESLRYSNQGKRAGAGFFLNGYSDDYANIGKRNSIDKIRYDAGGGISYSIKDIGSFSLSFSKIGRYDGQDMSITSAGYSKSLAPTLAVFAEIKRTEGSPSYNEGFVGINYYPWKETSLAARYQQTEDLRTASLQLLKNPPLGEGLGYRAYIENIESSSSSGYTINPSIQYNAKYGIYKGEYFSKSTDGDTINSFRIGASGGIIYVGDTFGLTRPVTDSFGLVKLDSLEGVRVYYANQEIGRTDSSGKVFIPNMASYQENQISINDKDVPVDYYLSDVNRYVSPPLRSGSCIIFAAKKLQYMTGMLNVKVGDRLEPVEFYEVKMNVDGKEIVFPTGKGGEIYLEMILPQKQIRQAYKDCSYIGKEDDYLSIRPGRYNASFDYKGKACNFDINVPVSDEMIINLGDISCEVTQEGN